MRLLIVGCSNQAVDTLRRMRLAPALRPLHLCFWDPDIEAARGLMNAVGAGTCLREVTPALLVNVDVALVFDDRESTRAALASAQDSMRPKLPLPAMVGVRFDGGNGRNAVRLDCSAVNTAEQRIVCGVLLKALP